jgi:RHS repeat-associated protein
MLFVAAGAQPANLLYVHADHLGSPQKLTDASQATAWDGVFDPFGEEVAIAGLAAMPLRFPGQYADEETGYSYNYFRDYDPAMGRYVQPDPVGLTGDLNLYAYVGSNPLARMDAKGLQPEEFPTIEFDPNNPEPNPVTQENTVQPDTGPGVPDYNDESERIRQGAARCLQRFLICMAKMKTSRLCRLPYFGRAAKAGRAVGCTAGFTICMAIVGGGLAGSLPGS